MADWFYFWLQVNLNTKNYSCCFLFDFNFRLVRISPLRFLIRTWFRTKNKFLRESRNLESLIKRHWLVAASNKSNFQPYKLKDQTMVSIGRILIDFLSLTTHPNPLTDAISVQIFRQLQSGKELSKSNSCRRSRGMCRPNGNERRFGHRSFSNRLTTISCLF